MLSKNMIHIPEYTEYRNEIIKETKNSNQCSKIQGILTNKLNILPEGLNSNIFQFIPCKRCERISKAYENEAKNMEYHTSCFNDLKLYYFVKTHPFPKYFFITDKIVPNIKVNCVKYDKETKTRTHYTRGIVFNKKFHKLIKAFYKELYISTATYDFERYHLGEENNKALLDSCYEILKALFQMHYNNDKYMEMLYSKLLHIRRYWF